MRTLHLLHSNTTAPIKGWRKQLCPAKESMGVERNETPSRRGSHVGTVIKSVSQALGLWKSDYDLNEIVTYKEGKFVANKEMILEVLNNGSNTDKINVLKQLTEEMINIISEERYEIWEIVSHTIDLTKQGTVRRESFRLLDEILKLGKAVTCNELAIYQVISENVNLNGHDQDMDLLLRCLHHLFQNSDMKCYEKYSESPIDEFLMKAFNCIMKSDSQETVALIISLISQCLKQKSDLFPQPELRIILEQSIGFCVKANEIEVLISFLDFLTGYVTAGGKYDDCLCSILSILGCSNGIDAIESTGKCNDLMDLLLSSGNGNTVVALCDVIKGNYNDKIKHRKGNRSIIGSIRLLSHCSKYLGEKSDSGKLVTEFFDNSVYHLLHAFEVTAALQDKTIHIEIVKFIVEVLERPYVIDGYYGYFVEQNQFWELLNMLSCDSNAEISFNYQSVLIELFNKLQNLDLNNYYQRQLVRYLEKNYEILTSYNIQFVLKYYSENLLCVCGASTWKMNCKNIVEKYFSTCPLEVQKTLTDALLYCLSLKIDEPSLNFYIDLICYKSVFGLEFTLNDKMLSPLANVLANIDIKLFEKVMDDYRLEITGTEDLNGEFINKVLWHLILKAAFGKQKAEKTTILLGAIVNVTSSTLNSRRENIFVLNILLLKCLRVCKQSGVTSCYFDRSYINAQFLRLELPTVVETSIQKATKVAYDTVMQLEDSFDLFPKERSQFFPYTNLQSILAMYTHVLDNTKSTGIFFILCKQLKLQLLNFAMIDSIILTSIEELVELLTSQLQDIHQFSFEKPHWLTVDQIRMPLVDTLYGLLPYLPLIDSQKSIGLMRVITLDYHFSHNNRNAFLNLITSCIYAAPKAMSHFIFPILKMIEDSLYSPSDFCSGLEFIEHFVELSQVGQYELKSKYTDLIMAITTRISRYKHNDGIDEITTLQGTQKMSRIIALKMGSKQLDACDTEIKVCPIKFIACGRQKFMDLSLLEDVENSLKTDSALEGLNSAEFNQYFVESFDEVSEDKSVLQIILLKNFDDSKETPSDGAIIISPIGGNKCYMEIKAKSPSGSEIYAIVGKESVGSFLRVMVEFRSAFHSW
jgi:hypothetical protein